VRVTSARLIQEKDGLDKSSPYVKKNDEDKGIITPTLILPPQGGGDLRKEKDGFPFSRE